MKKSLLLILGRCDWMELVTTHESKNASGRIAENGPRLGSAIRGLDCGTSNITGGGQAVNHA